MQPFSPCRGCSFSLMYWAWSTPHTHRGAPTHRGYEGPARRRPEVRRSRRFWKLPGSKRHRPWSRPALRMVWVSSCSVECCLCCFFFFTKSTANAVLEGLSPHFLPQMQHEVKRVTPTHTRHEERATTNCAGERQPTTRRKTGTRMLLRFLRSQCWHQRPPPTPQP